jgi:hypothetical protein
MSDEKTCEYDQAPETLDRSRYGGCTRKLGHRGPCAHRFSEAVIQVGELCVTKEPATDAMWKRREAREAAYKAYASLENQLAEVTAERDDALEDGNRASLEWVSALAAAESSLSLAMTVVEAAEKVIPPEKSYVSLDSFTLSKLGRALSEFRAASRISSPDKP